jgi:hypothetical protein
MRFGLILLVILLTACAEVRDTVNNCPDGKISWVDMLKVNDVEYVRLSEEQGEC